MATTPARSAARRGRAPGRTLCCLTLAVGLAAGCSSPDPDAGTAGTRQTTAADTAVAHLDPAAFATAAAEPATVLLDVRTPAEFAAGHLPRAINLDMQAADFTTRIIELDKTTHYALYCRSGHRSGLAAEQMRAAGFSRVVDLSGGIIAWTAAGGAVTTS
jgi:rhodanese-related sulfurtransferase